MPYFTNQLAYSRSSKSPDDAATNYSNERQNSGWNRANRNLFRIRMLLLDCFNFTKRRHYLGLSFRIARKKRRSYAFRSRFFRGIVESFIKLRWKPFHPFTTDWGRF
ncbi:hypothetical protein BJP07_00980 [Corynebacterium sp. NML130628]|nr:hypothetical protein BJP07_00980 [Corynebacterium sp. NML130628]